VQSAKQVPTADEASTALLEPVVQGVSPSTPTKDEMELHHRSSPGKHARGPPRRQRGATPVATRTYQRSASWP
jgi:hypothetical protein